MVEALDHRRPRKPALNHLAAGVPAVLKHLKDAICHRPVVHCVDDKLSSHQARVEAHKLVKRYRQHNDVRVLDGIRCPLCFRSRYDHLRDERDLLGAARSRNRDAETRVQGDSRDHRPHVTGAKHGDSLRHVRATK